MDEIKCIVCHRYYDRSQRLPLLFPNCRHTSCKTCLQRQLAEATQVGTNQVQCPQCSQKVYCDSRDGINSVFPSDPEVLALMRADKTEMECIHWQSDRNLVCFDPKCDVKNKFCGMCQKAFHNRCNPGLIFAEGMASQKLLAPQLNLPGALPVANLRRELKSGLKSLEDTLTSMLTQCELIFQTEVEDTLRCSSSPATVMAYKERFHFAVDPEGMLIPRAKNEDALQEFGASVTKFFSGEFFRRVNDLRNAFWTDRLSMFQRFVQPDLVPFEPIFQQFEGANKRLLSEIVLADGPWAVPTSLHNFLKAAEGRLTKGDFGFKLQSSFGGSPEEEGVFRRMVNEAFLDGGANWDGVFNGLKDTLEKYALRQGLKHTPEQEFWDLKMTLGEPAESKQDPQVVSYGRGDFVVSFQPIQ